MKLSSLTAIVIAAAIATPAFAAGDFTTTPAAVKPGTYALDPAHGKITWSLNHLGFSTYTGQFTGVSGTLKLDPKAPAKSTLTASVAIASIGTLNPALDAELKGDKFFNAAKYPTASFASTKIVATGPRTAKVYGDLTLMGVTKPEVLTVTFNQGGTNPIVNVYEVGFDGKTTIKRSQFGLSAYVPYVGDDVALQIEGEFHLQP